MLWELRNSGHSILITDGEEHGKVGAKYLKKTNRKLYRELNRHRYMLALDLKGTDNCSFNQVYNTKKFKQYIENELGFANGKSTGGNDLQILCHRVGGANLGIGYHDFHTNKETLVLSEWENTLNKVTTFLERPQQKFHSRVLPKYMRYAEICVNKGLRILKIRSTEETAYKQGGDSKNFVVVDLPSVRDSAKEELQKQSEHKTIDDLTERAEERKQSKHEETSKKERVGVNIDAR